RVEFSFAALSYIAPGKVLTRYQLEGFDPGWIEAGTQRSVLYSKLPPGHYAFRVQACNADGVWNSTGSRIRMEVPPAFHETGWFKGICGLAGVLVLFGAYRWRVRHMETRQRNLKIENDLLEVKIGVRTGE